MDNVFTKNCPKCNIVQCYTQKSHLTYAIKLNRVCKNCVVKKEKYIIQKEDRGYLRVCPACKCETICKRKSHYLSNERKNRKCHSCAAKERIKKRFPLGKNKKPCLNKVSNIQRVSFYKWIKGKENGFDQYIGLNREDFKEYITKGFGEGMSWENWSKSTWHIDHLKQLCWFDNLSDENQKKIAWNYKNLRPLYAKDNRSRPKDKDHTLIFIIDSFETYLNSELNSPLLI